MRGFHDGIMGSYAVRPVNATEGELGEFESDVDGDGEAGDRKTKRLQDPQMPLDVEEHELTHLPFRNWCRHCVRGRGKEFPHRRVGDDAGMPELHADMCFGRRE